MVKDRVSRYWGLYAGIAVALVVLVFGSAHAVFAASQQSGGIVAGVGTPDWSEDEQAREPTPVEEESPGGVVPPTATPGGGTGGEALAPGTVTVVVWTSDQGPLPERAMVCIGEVCQSVSGSRSGIDLWFDRVEKGWQQIVVTVGAPYRTATADVEVKPGSNTRVELTLVATQPDLGDKLDPTPPPVSAEGPLRTPLQLEGATTNPVANVAALPSTGALPDSPDSHAPLLALMTGALLLLGAAAALRGAHRT